MLKDDILVAFPGLTAKTRDDKAIAELLSQGRVKITSVVGGLPKFIEILGVEQALPFLTAARAKPDGIDYWLVESLRDVRADMAAPGIQAMIAASSLSEGQRASLVGALTVPNPVTEQEVAAALAGFDDPPVKPEEKPVVIEPEEAEEAVASVKT